MSSGLYTHTTRGTGTVLTAAIYNSDHQNHITNHNPSMLGGYADNVSQFRTTADPGPVGTESLPASLAGELERIRFVLDRIVGKTHWYEAPASDLETLAGGGGDLGDLITALGSIRIDTIELGHDTDTTLSRLAAGILAVEGKALAFREPGRNPQTGSSYELALTDIGKIVTMNNAGANTLTVPANATIAIPVDSIINIVQIGAGITSIDGAVGVTVNGVSGGIAPVRNRWQGVSLLKINTNEWICSGDIGAFA